MTDSKENEVRHKTQNTTHLNIWLDTLFKGKDKEFGRAIIRKRFNAVLTRTSSFSRP